MTEWTLAPGARITRAELHDAFGGLRQSGISCSTQTPNVFLFSHPRAGDEYANVDSWGPDGCFRYTGQGQLGDQKMVGGNRAILLAESRGQALRLFQYSGRYVEYQGQFALDAWHALRAPQPSGGQPRSVIVYRLRPLDGRAGSAESVLDKDHRHSADADTQPQSGVLYESPGAVGVPPGQLLRSVEPQIIVASAMVAERLKNDPEGVRALTSRQFEQLVFEILTDRGHEAYLTPATRDGGKDVLAYFETDFGKLLCLVETKRYSSHRKVGFGMVQRLYGAFASHGASCAMLVTTSSFSRPARDFQAEHRYQLALRDYADLLAWLRDYGTGGKRK